MDSVRFNPFQTLATPRFVRRFIGVGLSTKPFSVSRGNRKALCVVEQGFLKERLADLPRHFYKVAVGRHQDAVNTEQHQRSVPGVALAILAP